MEPEVGNNRNLSRKRARKPNSRFLNDSYVHDVPKRSKGDANVENDESSSESLIEGNGGDVTIDNGTITSQKESVGRTDELSNESSMEQMNGGDGNGDNRTVMITELKSVAQKVAKLEAEFKKMQKQRVEDAARIKTLEADVDKLKKQRVEDAARIKTLEADVDKLKNQVDELTERLKQKKCDNCNEICTPGTESTDLWCGKCIKKEVHKKGKDFSTKLVNKGKIILEGIVADVMTSVYPPTPREPVKREK